LDNKREAFHQVTEKRIFPEAVITFSIMGWNDGTEKIILTGRVSRIFDLNRVHKSGAKFDPEKQMVQPSVFNQAEDDETLIKPSPLF
jgi:glutamyl-tRNA synthetase